MRNRQVIMASGIMSTQRAVHPARRSGGGLISVKSPLRLLLIVLGLAGMATGQSQPPAGPSAPPQAQSQPKKSESLGEVARKAKAKKSRAGKVYTEEDLSQLQSGSVSVVGQGGRAANGSSEPIATGAEAKKDDSAGPGKNAEAYWRGKARKLQEQIAAVDQEIAKMKEEIKSSGGAGFDASSGLRQNVIYIHDRNSGLKQLEAKKEKLQNQLNLLQEEGRKAGAPAGWFR